MNYIYAEDYAKVLMVKPLYDMPPKLKKLILQRIVEPDLIATFFSSAIVYAYKTVGKPVKKPIQQELLDIYEKI